MKLFGFKKKKEIRQESVQEVRYLPETEAMIAELEMTFWYKPNVNTTNKYSFINGNLKESYVKSYAQFDDDKKIFSLQISKDNENWVDTEPFVRVEGKCFGVGDCENGLLNFPMTLRHAMMLANIYAGAKTEDYNYWRVGIKQDWGFIPCFSGKLRTPVFDTQGEMSASVICHLE